MEDTDWSTIFKKDTTSGGVDKSKMATTELPGLGEFYLYNQTSYDPDFGTGGSVWLVEPQAADALSEGGIDAVLENPQLRENASIFIQAIPETGDDPGLGIDYDNNPDFHAETPHAEDKAKGVIDVLASTGKQDPLASSVREMISGVLRARAQEVALVKGRDGAMKVNNAFFERVSDPERIISIVFDGYKYSGGKVNNMGGRVEIELDLPLSQFLGEE